MGFYLRRTRHLKQLSTQLVSQTVIRPVRMPISFYPLSFSLTLLSKAKSHYQPTACAILPRDGVYEWLQ